MQNHQIELSDIKKSISDLLTQTITLESLSKNISSSAADTSQQTKNVADNIGDIKVIIRGVSSNIEKIQQSLDSFYELVQENNKPLDISAITEGIQRDIGENFVELREFLVEMQEGTKQVDIAKERDEARQMLARELSQKLSPLDFSQLRNQSSDNVRNKILAMQQNSLAVSKDMALFVEKIRRESPPLSRWMSPRLHKSREALLSEVDAFVSSIAQENLYQDLLGAVSEHVIGIDNLSGEFRETYHWITAIGADEKEVASEEDPFSGFGASTSDNGAFDPFGTEDSEENTFSGFGASTSGNGTSDPFGNAYQQASQSTYGFGFSGSTENGSSADDDLFSQKESSHATYGDGSVGDREPEKATESFI